MLSKLAVKKFRKRKLDSFEFMKGLSMRQLQRMVSELEPRPIFISPKPMWKHQLVAFLVGVYEPQFLLYLDMGLGKSRVILELIAYLKRCKKKPCALVVVPNDVAIESWMMQVEEHRPDLKCVPLYGSTKERLDTMQIENDADLMVVSYAGLNWMCCSLQKTKGRKSRKLSVDAKKLKLITSTFNFICLDEVTAIMHHTSLTYEVCRKISWNFKNRFGMAGIALGRDPQALWSQFYFCDHGETLGETLGMFRDAFFKRKVNYFSGFYDYVFDKKYSKIFNKTVKHRSIQYSEGECKDMPKRVYKPVYVPFTDDMKNYYNQMVSKVNEDKRDLHLVRNSFLHMRQLSSGFIGIIDDDTSERIQIEFPSNPKMEALTQIVQEIPPDRKFLIYYQFNWTGDRISKELDNLGIKYGQLRGGQKKEGPRILRSFTESKKLRALVINNGVGAFALNLQIANYEIFVESPTSPIVRGQAEKRIHRGEQKRRCFIIDILMKDNTADENIQKFLKEGKDIEGALMRGKHKIKFRRVK